MYARRSSPATDRFTHLIWAKQPHSHLTTSPVRERNNRSRKGL